MGLLDRVAAVFRRSALTPRQTTSDELPVSAASPLSLAAEWRAASDRRSMVTACREMYRSDTRARGVIQTLARDIVRAGFTVEVEQGDQRAVEIAEQLAERLDISQRLDDWIRLALRDGDTFLELGVDANLDVVEVSRKPTLELRRATNIYDRFDDPRRAFWQGDEWAQTPPTDAVWFAEWQIIHARWAHDEGSRYGNPLFSSAQKPYKRMTEGETDLAVRRKTRAGLKYVHKFPPGTDRTVIETYKVLNKDSLDNPLAAIADYFGTVDVQAVQGDAQLGEVADVMHHIRTWWLASPVAMSLLGYGQDLNRDVLEKQDEQYQRALMGLRAWPETEIVKPLLERQWLLKGILPAGLKYRVSWGNQDVVTAAAVEQAANAGLKLRALGWSDQQVAALLMTLLPDLSAYGGGSAAAQGGETRETRATAGRMAAIAEQLGVTIGSGSR